jgi:hypothetical protein
VVTNAIKHYRTDNHQRRKLTDIKCVCLGPYIPGEYGDDEDCMPYSFVVGDNGRIVQALPLELYARSPSLLLVGVFGQNEPKPALLNATATLCAALFSRAPRVMRLSDLWWSKETMASLHDEIHDIIDSGQQQTLAAMGIHIL